MSCHQVSEWFVNVDTNASEASVGQLMDRLSEFHHFEDWWLERGEVTVEGVDSISSAEAINEALLLLV